MIFALALDIALDLEHPLRRRWPVLNGLRDVDEIALWLVRLAWPHGEYRLALSA